MDVFRFLDIILTLNKNLEIHFDEKARILDKELNMQVMTTWERQGFEKGVVQGGAEILTNLLKVKFKDVPEKYLIEIKKADPKTLNRWCTNFVFANSVEDVFRVQ